MFTLVLDRKLRILRARFSGVFSSEDLDALDAAVVGFLSRHADGGDKSLWWIFDLSDVEAVAVPRSRVAERGVRLPIVQGRQILVTPPNADEGFGVGYRKQQLQLGRDITIVRSLAEAHALLGAAAPHYEPVADS